MEQNVGLLQGDMSNNYVVEMHMLQWIYGHTRGDHVRNDGIHERLGVTPVKEKLMQHRL
jgi:hypothetical protein